MSPSKGSGKTASPPLVSSGPIASKSVATVLPFWVSNAVAKAPKTVSGRGTL
jgi:hypothetical protein